MERCFVWPTRACPMPSNAPAMRMAGPIISGGWPRLRPGATRAPTPGTAAPAGSEPLSPPVFAVSALFFLSHPGSETDPDQQPFRRDETTDGLAPRLFLVPDEHSISSRFKLRRRLFDTVDIELELGLRDRNI